MNGITKHPLKHFSSRRGAVVNMVILHYISAVKIQPNSPCNTARNIQLLDDLRVSAHYLIDRMGNIVQLVDESMKSWHCGVSKWKGRKNLNRYSIGIEIIGQDGERFTEKQYDSLIALLRDIVERRGIKEDMILGHSDVSPGRKTDIGRYCNFTRIYDAVFRDNDKVIAEPVEPRPSKISRTHDSFLSRFLSLFNT